MDSKMLRTITDSTEDTSQVVTLEEARLLPPTSKLQRGWLELWGDGSIAEDSEEWSDCLHAYKKQYLLIVCFYAFPCYAIFMYSVVMSLKYGSWWNTSAGQPYIANDEDIRSGKYIDVYRSLPAVLDTHMYFAVAMLAFITFQIGFAIVGTWCKQSVFKYHRLNGIVAALVMFIASFLGTISLFLCDVQPKRGAENLFFVSIGVGIAVFLVMALYYAGKRRYGLHFQYMCYSVCLVFSPGWNRITTVIIRHALTRLRDVSQQCFVLTTWAQEGYLYVWSFYMGVVTLMFWWVVVPWTRAPFFKKYSVGCFYFAAIVGILLACTWQTFVDWERHACWPLSPIEKCDARTFDIWRNFTIASQTQGLHSLSMGYGVCSPRGAQFQQGVPSVFVNENTLLHMRSDDVQGGLFHRDA